MTGENLKPENPEFFGRKFKRASKSEMDEEERKRSIEKWNVKTEVGRKVKNREIKDIDEIIDQGKILEEQIVDSLLKLDSDLLSLGQSKGKFGGGKRRAWKQTQRKTEEGNIPTFSCVAIVGDKKGHVGMGFGEGQETLPARTKALRKAKLNIIKIKRGCGSFDCICSEEHSIPFKVTGKSGSCEVVLYPAPQGTGLVIGNEGKKILELAGIKDIYSRVFGQTRTTLNFAKAVMEAIKKTRRNLD